MLTTIAKGKAAGCVLYCTDDPEAVAEAKKKIDEFSDKAKDAVEGLAVAVIVAIVVSALCGLAICVIIVKCCIMANRPKGVPVQQPGYAVQGAWSRPTLLFAHSSI